MRWRDKVDGVKAIPTIYNGIQYRSRLEATWAAFFERLNWDFEYEPAMFEGAGWTPDFAVPSMNLLVEVKPQPNLFEWNDRAAIEYAAKRPVPPDWLVMFVGVSPMFFDLQVREAKPEEPDFREIYGGDLVTVAAFGHGMMGGDTKHLALCVGSVNLAFGEGDDYDAAWYVLPIPPDAEVMPSHRAVLTQLMTYHVREMWASAKNAVQWRPPNGP